MNNIDVILDALTEKIKALELELSLKDYKIKRYEDQEVEKRPSVIIAETRKKGGEQ